MPSVLQSWVEKLPIRMQSTLVLGLRGPDTAICPNVKIYTRWLRGLTFRPGNPDNVLQFMYAELPPRIVEKNPTARELEFCTQHFLSHLMHSLQIVGYGHPHIAMSGRAWALYDDLCKMFHLPVEPIEELGLRLRQIDWPGQPDNLQEAIEILRSREKTDA